MILQLLKILPAGGFVLLFLGLILTANMQESIELYPDETECFVIDPAEFNPDDGHAAVLRHEPFGRKSPAIYGKAEREDGTPVISAESRNAISSLTTPLKADPYEFQYLRWEWKIESVLEKGDLTKKEGDDYVARVYVTFDYDPSDLGFGERIKYRLYKAFTSFDIPLRSLNYIWANKAPVGTIAESPFTGWVQYIAVQSGNERAGEWMVEKRNILEDYRAAFGEEPSAITGITIMTDSDNTGERTKAWFGKIKLSKN